MDTAAANSKSLFLFLLSILIVSSSGSSHIPVKNFPQKEHKRTHKQTPTQRKLVKTTQHDFLNPPITTYPNTPVTNPVTTPSPVTFPPDTSTPPIVTVPSANPGPVTPTPVTYPPVTNPVTTPSTTIPGGQPVTNPVTGGTIPATNPVVAPPVITNAPAVPGQSWCMARSDLPETVIQAALDYACGIGGADCSAIQQGASCYNPNTLQSHASYAFNSYYQRIPVQTSCNFGGTAIITNVNPSSGSCIFPTSSPSFASPATTSPTTTTPIPTPTTEPSSASPGTTSPTTSTPIPTPTTGSSPGATPIPTGSGSPPTVMNPTNPALGGGITGYGEVPPAGSNSSVSTSTSLRPIICCFFVMTSIITGISVLDM